MPYLGVSVVQYEKANRLFRDGQPIEEL